MFNVFIRVYDWYHEKLEPTCAPYKYDDNILAPVYYGKVSTTEKSNAVEVSLAPHGGIAIVRKFSTKADDTIGARYALTPSCIQHRRNGSCSKDKEYQFFNKFSVVFGNDRSTWLRMVNAWIEHHESSGKPKETIAIIKKIRDVVVNTPASTFLMTWDEEDANGEKPLSIDDKTYIVFTDNGDRIFEKNPALYYSYRDFYEEWCRDIYEITDGVSTLSGEDDLIMRTKDDNTPVSFGIAYSNNRKMIMKPKSNITTLDIAKRFNVQKDFSNYTSGLRDMWKLHTTFDYLSEQQRERDTETRNIFFFVPNGKDHFPYEDVLVYNDMLTTLKQYHEGYKWECPADLEGIELCYIYWTSSSVGRSSISDYQILPAEQYVENVSEFYEFFEHVHKFCLYRISNLLEIDSQFVRKSQHELIRAILNGSSIPEHVVKAFMIKSLSPIKTSSSNQASRHSGYKGEYAAYYYRNVLETTVGLILYNRQKKGQKGALQRMALDRTYTDRNYLYGRLVAIYQQAEEIAMSGAEKRTTNAEKSMNTVFTRPFTSIQTLARRVTPYLNKLSGNKPGAKVYIDKELEEVYGNFIAGEYEDNSPLNSDFLIGYYCQRQAFYQKKNENESEEGKEDTND